MSVYIYIFYAFIFLAMYRLIAGPTLYDRLMAFHIIQSCAIIIICIYAVIYNKSFYLDIAMVFALLSFSEVVAYSKFYKEEHQQKNIRDYKEHIKSYFTTKDKKGG